MKDNIQVVKSWINKAYEDLEMGHRAMKGDKLYPASACFHAQQSAEKILKGCLINFGYEITKDLKTHELEILIATLEKQIELSHDLHLWVEDLDDYGVKPRYPTDTGDPTFQEAIDALRYAENIIDYCLLQILKF